MISSPFSPAVRVEGVVAREPARVPLAHLPLRLDVLPLPAAQQAPILEALQARQREGAGGVQADDLPGGEQLLEAL